MGYTGYLVGQKIYLKFGALSAALYLSLFFIYAQHQIGYTHTETLGLILGNLSLILLWETVNTKKIAVLIYASFVTILAISVRAGAFFVLPFIALWSGYFFRESKRFSWKVFCLSLLAVFISYFLISTLYSRLLVAPGDYSFGNFAYSFYGQVHGGTGWHRAIEELGTRDPKIIMDSAVQFFKTHPTSLLIGAAKSYRDFFIPGIGIFSFYGSQMNWLDQGLWVVGLFLVFRGLYLSIKNIHKGLPALLLAGFLGIFFSIPFLPPIDGGNRFYASTMPIFFALVSFATSTQRKEVFPEKSQRQTHHYILFSGVLALGTVVFPILVFYLTPQPTFTIPSCPAKQVPYAIQVHPASHIDLLPSHHENSSICNNLSLLCLEEFHNNGVERNIDLLFQELVNQAKDSPTRIFAANNLIPGGRSHFFISPTEELSTISPRTTITGCATELILVELKSRPVLYRIESVIVP